MLPPAAKRPKTYSPGITTMIQMLQAKYPGTTEHDAKSRAIDVLGNRCYACVQPRNRGGPGQRNKCTTPGCNLSSLHPTIAAEVNAV